MPTLDSRPALTGPVAADLIHIQDVSDKTDSPQGTSKKCTLGSLRASLGLAQTTAENVFSADQTLQHGKALDFEGHPGNARWRIFTASANQQPTDQVLYFVYNGRYDPEGGWLARDVDEVAVLRHGFESLWDGLFEWNLDVAPPGQGTPNFRKRLYGMFYNYDADNTVWNWRSTPEGTTGAGADMQLTPEVLQVGGKFSVRLDTGKITVAAVDRSPGRALILGGSGDVQARIDLQAGSAAVPDAAVDLRDANNAERGGLFFTGGESYFLTDAQPGDVGVRVMGGRFVLGVSALSDDPPPVRLVLDADGNLGLGTATFGEGASQVLALAAGTPPAAPADGAVQVYAAHLPDGGATLGLHTDGAAAVGRGAPSADRTIAVEVNGETLYLLAATSPQ